MRACGLPHAWRCHACQGAAPRGRNGMLRQLIPFLPATPAADHASARSPSRRRACRLSLGAGPNATAAGGLLRAAADRWGGRHAVVEGAPRRWTPRGAAAQVREAPVAALLSPAAPGPRPYGGRGRLPRPSRTTGFAVRAASAGLGLAAAVPRRARYVGRGHAAGRHFLNNPARGRSGPRSAPQGERRARWPPRVCGRRALATTRTPSTATRSSWAGSRSRATACARRLGQRRRAAGPRGTAASRGQLFAVDAEARSFQRVPLRRRAPDSDAPGVHSRRRGPRARRRRDENTAVRPARRDRGAQARGTARCLAAGTTASAKAASGPEPFGRQIYVPRKAGHPPVTVVMIARAAGEWKDDRETRISGVITASVAGVLILTLLSSFFRIICFLFGVGALHRSAAPAPPHAWSETDKACGVTHACARMTPRGQPKASR